MPTGRQSSSNTAQDTVHITGWPTVNDSSAEPTMTSAHQRNDQRYIHNKTWHAHRLLDWKLHAQQKLYLVCWTVTNVHERNIIAPNISDVGRYALVSHDRQRWEIRNVHPRSEDTVHNNILRVEWEHEWMTEDKLQHHIDVKARMTTDKLIRELESCKNTERNAMQQKHIRKCTKESRAGWVTPAYGVDFYTFLFDDLMKEYDTYGWKLRKLLDKQQLRAVMLHQDFLEKDRVKNNLSVKKDRRTTLLVQGTGTLMPNPCTACEKGNSIFLGCVADPDWFGGACACCKYANKETLCKHHQSHSRNADASRGRASSDGDSRNAESNSSADEEGNASHSYSTPPPTTPAQSPRVTRSASRRAVRAQARKAHIISLITPEDSGRRQRMQIFDTLASPEPYQSDIESPDPFGLGDHRDFFPQREVTSDPLVSRNLQGELAAASTNVVLAFDDGAASNDCRSEPPITPTRSPSVELGTRRSVLLRRQQLQEQHGDESIAVRHPCLNASTASTRDGATDTSPSTPTACITSLESGSAARLVPRDSVASSSNRKPASLDRSWTNVDEHFNGGAQRSRITSKSPYLARVRLPSTPTAQPRPGLVRSSANASPSLGQGEKRKRPLHDPKAGISNVGPRQHEWSSSSEQHKRPRL